MSTRRVGRKVHKITNIVKIPVYCKCRMPEIKDLKMIQCSTCSEWYHIDVCVQVSEEVIKKRSSIWLCDNCDKISKVYYSKMKINVNLKYY